MGSKPVTNFTAIPQAINSTLSMKYFFGELLNLWQKIKWQKISVCKVDFFPSVMEFQSYSKYCHNYDFRIMNSWKCFKYDLHLVFKKSN